MRRLSRLLLAFAGVPAAVAWRLSTMTPEAMIAAAEARLAVAGIPVAIEGRPELEFWPWPGVRVGAVSSGGAGAPVRLSAERARLSLSTGDLVRGRLVHGQLHLSDATLELNDRRLAAPLVLTRADLVTSSGADGALSILGDGTARG